MPQLLRDKALAWVPTHCEIRWNPDKDVTCFKPVVAILEAMPQDRDNNKPAHVAFYVCQDHADFGARAIAYKPQGILTYLEEMSE